MSRRPIGEPIGVRLSESMRAELEALAEEMQSSLGGAARAAMEIGIPRARVIHRQIRAATAEILKQEPAP